MKKYGLLLCTFLFLALSSRAQDVVTLVNGTVIQGQVVQITPSMVVCTDINNPGHNISIRKSGIATVVYANGSKTIYNLTGDTGKRRKNIPDNGSVHGWYFGATASGGVGTVTSNDPTYTVGATTTAGCKILATGTLGEHLGIQFGMGVDFSGYSVNYINNSIFAGTSDIFAQRYVTMPLRLLYLSNSRRRLGFYANAGMDFSILVSATDNEGDFLSSYYNNLLISEYASCGIVFRNSNARGIWMLGPFFKTSVNNIYSKEHIVWEGEPFMSTGNTGNFTTIGVTLTFMANFGRWEKNGY